MGGFIFFPLSLRCLAACLALDTPSSRPTAQAPTAGRVLFSEQGHQNLSILGQTGYLSYSLRNVASPQEGALPFKIILQ